MTSEIRLARPGELSQILAVYEDARGFMAENGNPDQWGRNGYPSAELLKKDVDLGRLFVIVRNGRIAAAFVLFIGDEPTYRVINEGNWLNDKPYLTVHRLGSVKDEHGIAKECLDFAVSVCREKGLDLRADTHRKNLPMRHILEKYGFTCCGVIFVADGTERMAYQLMID